MTRLSKILIISSEFPPGPGGIGNHAYNLSLYLSKNGHDITVLTNSENASDIEAEEFKLQQNFKIVFIKRYEWPIITYLERIYETIRILYSEKVDFCFCTGKFSLWLGYLIKISKFKVKVIAIVHGSEINSPSGYNHLITNKALKNINNIIAVSEFTKSLLPKDLQNNAIVIPNAIDYAFFNHSVNNEASGRSVNPILVTVGNLTKRKGQFNVIKALPRLLKVYPNLHYHIVGLPTLQTEMQELAGRIRVENNITFHGKVSVEMLKKVYRMSDIFIMLSETQASGDTEGFGIAILEANAVGLPAIGSKNCGIESAIWQGKSGFSVDPHNEMEIEDALNKIIENYDVFSENARVWAYKHDWARVGKAYDLFLKR